MMFWTNARRWLVPIFATATIVTCAVLIALPVSGRGSTSGSIEVTTIADGTRGCKNRIRGQDVALAESSLTADRHVVMSEAEVGGEDLVLGTCSPARSSQGIAEFTAQGLESEGWHLQLAPSRVEEAASLARILREQLSAPDATVLAQPSIERSTFVETFAQLGGKVDAVDVLGDVGSTSVLVVLGDERSVMRKISRLHDSGWDAGRAVVVPSPALGTEIMDAVPRWIRSGTLQVGGYVEQQSGFLADYLIGLERAGSKVDPSYEGFLGYLEGRLLVEAVTESSSLDASEIAAALGEISWDGSEVVRTAFPGAAAGQTTVALFHVVPDIDSMKLMGMAMPGHHGHHAKGRMKSADRTHPWGWSRVSSFM